MFCRHCGNQIDEDVIICPKCGKQVQDLKTTSSINFNTNSLNFDGFGDPTRPKCKLAAILLCCIGFISIGGIHKFYEGKIGLGILYLLTGGLFLIGTIVDLVNLIQKEDTYMIN